MRHTPRFESGAQQSPKQYGLLVGIQPYADSDLLGWAIPVACMGEALLLSRASSTAPFIFIHSYEQSMNYRTPKELAYEYDVSETTVIRWCRTGYLPSIKVGGRWRIDPDVDLESLSNPVNERVREEMKSRGW